MYMYMYVCMYTCVHVNIHVLYVYVLYVQDVAVGLASVAPNSQLQDFYEQRPDGPEGQIYYVARVEFDGNAAGQFGSAIEFRNVTVDKVGSGRGKRAERGWVE